MCVMTSITPVRSIVVLTLLHVTTYFNVYFQNSFFLGDFSYSYHGLIYFFTRVFHQVGFPEWNPYQRGGYPTLLSLQTGYLYPVHWLVAISGIPFTLNFASILQCLHVLFGAFGAFFLFNKLTDSVALGLCGGVAFHFFGGFFSNAAHPDFIRGFAFVPWLFVLLSPQSVAESIPRFLRENQSCLASPVVFLFCTGSYPGLIISIGLSCALYSLLFVAIGPRTHKFRMQYGVVLGFFGLGLLASLVHFVPALALNDYQVRAEALDDSKYHRMSWMNLLSLAISQLQIEVTSDVTMASLFVTAPILLSAMFFQLGSNPKLLPLIGVGTFAFLMSWGPDSILWRALTGAFPILKRSRFPIGEYRVLISLAIVGLGVSGLQRISLGAISPFRIFGYSAIFSITLGILRLVLLPQSNRFLSPDLQPGLTLTAETMLLVCAIGLTTVALHLLSRGHVAGGLLVLLAMAIDGLRFATAMGVYQLPSPHWRELQKRSNELIADGASHDVWDTATRPRRRSGFVRFSDLWQGYIDGYSGDFRLDDYGAPLTKSEAQCLSNKLCSTYMGERWFPVIVPDADSSKGSENLIAEGLSKDLATQSINLLNYGIESVTYAIDTLKPITFVENERFFPGWIGEIQGSDAILVSESIGDYRSWRLPAGQYELRTRFRFPLFRPFLYFSGVVSLFWIGLSVYVLQGAREK
jgi:hypothetical protein